MKRETFLTPDLIRERFQILKDYKPLIVPVMEPFKVKINNIPELKPHELIYYPAQKALVIVNVEITYHLNDISDYFNEEYRLKTKRYDETQSPWDFLQANKKKIEEECQRLYNRVNPILLRETLFYLTHEAATFRSTDLIAIIRKFNSKRILDPCMGWGNRLIAALACEVDLYWGTDPNPDLHQSYKDMVKMFGNEKTKCYFIESPFETCVIPPEIGEFDLVFTSPPYFDLEIYTDKPGQSHHYGSFERWFNEFLMVLCKKSWNRVVLGGRMCININNIRYGDPICQRMVGEMHKVPDAEYEGIIHFSIFFPGRFKSFQPIFCWKKVRIDIDPPIKLLKIDDFIVIQDADLPGGTKQRSITAFKPGAGVIPEDTKEIVYAGPHNGLAQVLIGLIAKLYNLKATMFTDSLNNPAVYRGLSYGVNYQIIPDSLSELQEMAQEYVNNDPNRFLLHFGMDMPMIHNALIKQITNALWRYKNDLDLAPERIWLVAGSTTLLNSLYKVFPQVEFHVVQVGKKIYPDQIDPARTKLYISDERFYSDAKEQPPYDTVPSYDAKLWHFFKKEHQINDMIWNLGSVKYMLYPESRPNDMLWNTYLVWERANLMKVAMVFNSGYGDIYMMREILMRVWDEHVARSLEQNISMTADFRWLKSELSNLYFLDENKAARIITALIKYRLPRPFPPENRYPFHAYGIGYFVTYHVESQEELRIVLQCRIFTSNQFHYALNKMLNKLGYEETSFFTLLPNSVSAGWSITKYSSEYILKKIKPDTRYLILSKDKIQHPAVTYSKLGEFPLYAGSTYPGYLTHIGPLDAELRGLLPPAI